MLAKSHVLSKSGVLQDGIWFAISYKYEKPLEVIILGTCQNNSVQETGAMKNEKKILFVRKDFTTRIQK